MRAGSKRNNQMTNHRTMRYQITRNITSTVIPPNRNFPRLRDHAFAINDGNLKFFRSCYGSLPHSLAGRISLLVIISTHISLRTSHKARSNCLVTVWRMNYPTQKDSRCCVTVYRYLCTPCSKRSRCSDVQDKSRKQFLFWI